MQKNKSHLNHNAVFSLYLEPLRCTIIVEPLIYNLESGERMSKSKKNSVVFLSVVFVLSITNAFAKGAPASPGRMPESSCQPATVAEEFCKKCCGGRLSESQSGATFSGRCSCPGLSFPFTLTAEALLCRPSLNAAAENMKISDKKHCPPPATTAASSPRAPAQGASASAGSGSPRAPALGQGVNPGVCTANPQSRGTNPMAGRCSAGRTLMFGKCYTPQDANCLQNANAGAATSGARK